MIAHENVNPILFQIIFPDNFNSYQIKNEKRFRHRNRNFVRHMRCSFSKNIGAEKKKVKRNSNYDNNGYNQCRINSEKCFEKIDH